MKLVVHGRGNHIVYVAKNGCKEHTNKSRKAEEAIEAKLTHINLLQTST